MEKHHHGIIGCGWVASFHVHALNQLSDRVAVKWVAGPELERAEDIAHQISTGGEVDILLDYREGLDRIDSVSILVPEARELIAVPSKAVGAPLEPNAEHILGLGGRLPFFVQIACSAAFECLVEAAEEDLDHDLVEQRFLEEASSHFRYLWEGFEAEQRQVIGCLVAGTGLSPDRAAVLKSLETDGYVENRAGKSLVFSRSFARFLQEAAPEEIHIAAEETLAVERPAARAETQVEPVPRAPSPFPHIIRQSAAIRQVFALTQKALATDVTVLLTGETGTGKELVARIIHQYSPRQDASFITVNCGAIAEHLEESELFGHKKGTFTDAVADREGLFEAASGGTLFLDEIGETSPSTQVKLLRVLQDGEIRRVGETRTRKVDVRLVCATNRDLEEEVAQGGFREDLYYRLYVLVLRLPALRERSEDIHYLVEHFLKGYESGISQEAMALLQVYEWPGNIRELENQIASAKAMAAGARIEPGHLWPRLEQRQPAAALPEISFAEDMTLKEARDQFEQDFIQARLRQCGGDLKETARHLGLSRSRLYELIRRYGLK